MDTDADFFRELDELIQKHRHKGTIHVIGLLEFGKQALILNMTTEAFGSEENKKLMREKGKIRRK